MSETIGQPFVTAALARGVRHRDLILRHAWPVALRPICAVYGLAIGALLSGSFVVEYVTAWPGLGQLMYQGLRARDIYLVTGCAAMGAFLLAIGTLVGDLLLAAADPRVREAETGS
jgi:peptide/nickel transport system permease protein